MKRMVFLLTLTLGLGLLIGALGEGLVGAQQPPVTRTELMRKDLGGLEEYEGILYLVEVAPGAATGKHSHPGDELVYVLHGAGVLEEDGKAPLAVKAGEVFSPPFTQVHNFKNTSPTEPVKVLVVLVAPKGQPLAIPAQ
jgi:quercetin dioxygenase-like cupin family protein